MLILKCDCCQNDIRNYDKYVLLHEDCYKEKIKGYEEEIKGYEEEIDWILYSYHQSRR